MNIAACLREACDELDWSPLQLAAYTGKRSSETARAWMLGRREPPGTVILHLIRSQPVFRRHLLGDEEAA